MTKKKKIILWVIGVFIGFNALSGIIMALNDKKIFTKNPEGTHPQPFKDGQLILGKGDTLCVFNDTLTLHSNEMTTAYFDLHFKEEMITTLQGEELKPNLKGADSLTVAFPEYKDSLDAYRILLFGKYHVSRDAYRMSDVKNLLNDYKRLKKKAGEAAFEALTSYNTDKKEKYLIWQQIVKEHEAKLDIDLIDYIDKITLIIGSGQTQKSYDFTPSMGKSYETLINFIFGETIYENK